MLSVSSVASFPLRAGFLRRRERTVRILHTADVHLGAAACGARLGSAAAALRRARPRALARVVELARTQKADLILIAGDLFDSARPDAHVAEEAMRLLSSSPVPVALIPGNHDPLTGRSVWTRRPWDDPPDGVKVFRAPEPVERPWGLDLVLYPCPLAAKDGSESPVSWIKDARREMNDRASLHVGLAHGTLKTIPDIDENEFPIEPDEIAKLGLDYLAIGHWHSRTDPKEAEANRSAYSGAPEPGKFGDPEGAALLIELDEGSVNISLVPTGTFIFREETRYIAEPQDVSALAGELAGLADAAHMFLRVRLEGTAPLAALEEAGGLCERLEETGFAFVDVDASGLAPEPEDIELARVPRGPLRRALEMLIEKERAASGEENATARRALAFAWELFGKQG